MLNVNDNGKLYIPLYIQKGNQIKINFTIEECKIGQKYYFPLAGNVNAYITCIKDYLKYLADTGDKHTWNYNINFRDAFFNRGKVETKTQCIELLELDKGYLKCLTYSDEDGFNIRHRSGLENMIHYRAKELAVEEMFDVAYSMTKDIPKSIDIALRGRGDFGYKGNYAIIDLNKWFKEGVMSYEKS